MWHASVLNVLILIKDLCLTRCCQYWNIIQLANLTDMEHNAVIKPLLIFNQIILPSRFIRLIFLVVRSDERQGNPYFKSKFILMSGHFTDCETVLRNAQRPNCRVVNPQALLDRELKTTCLANRETISNRNTNSGVGIRSENRATPWKGDVTLCLKHYNILGHCHRILIKKWVEKVFSLSFFRTCINYPLFIMILCDKLPGSFERDV